MSSEREELVDLVRESLSDALLCTRVWEAWQVGTMSDEDFMDAAGSDEFVTEFADALLAAGYRKTPEPVYEYGASADAFGGEPELHHSLDAARHVQTHSTTIYRRWTHGSEVTLHKRVKAGPWLPVDAETL